MARQNREIRVDLSFQEVFLKDAVAVHSAFPFVADVVSQDKWM